MDENCQIDVRKENRRTGIPGDAVDTWCKWRVVVVVIEGGRFGGVLSVVQTHGHPSSNFVLSKQHKPPSTTFHYAEMPLASHPMKSIKHPTQQLPETSTQPKGPYYHVI
jgi:hypothetical protein